MLRREAASAAKRASEQQLIGVRHLSSKSYPEALASLTLSLHHQPKARTYFLRATAHRSLGQLDQALADLNSAISLEPRAALYLSTRGQILRKLHLLKESLADQSAALALEPNNDLFVFNRALVLQDLDQLEAAVAEYDKVATGALVPVFKVLWNRAGCCRRLGRLRESVEDLQRCIEIEPRNHAVFNALGLSLFHAGQLDRATKVFSAAIEVREEPHYFANRGVSFLRMGRVEPALTDLRLALQLGASDAAFCCNIHFMRANALKLMGRTKEAIADYDECIRLAGEQPPFLHARALCYVEVGELVRAISQFERCLTLAVPPGSYVPSLYELGRCYRLDKNYEKSGEMLSRVIAVEPLDRRAWAERAITLHEAGKHEEAIADLTEAANLDDTVPGTFYLRGVCRLARGDSQGAEDDLVKALALTPAKVASRGAARQQALQAQLVPGRGAGGAGGGGGGGMAGLVTLSDEDLEDLADNSGTSKIGGGGNSSSSTDPPKPLYEPLGHITRGEVLGALGRARQRLKSYERAVADFTASLAESRSPGTLMDRALCYFDLGAHKKGIADLTEVLADPSLTKEPLGKEAKVLKARALFLRGQGYLASKKWDLSVRDNAASLDCRSNLSFSHEAYFNLALGYANLHEDVYAVSALTKAIHLRRCVHYLHERAKALQRLGQQDRAANERAVQDFKEVLVWQPSNSNARFRLAFCYHALGDFDRAAEEFTLAQRLDPQNPKLLVNFSKLQNVAFYELLEPGGEERGNEPIEEKK